VNVPLADLHKQYLSIKPEIDSAIQQVFESSQFILGKAVSQFEHDFAGMHEVKHCVAVGSGTDALHLPLWAMGIGKGDAVITTPFTFIATIEMILLCGAQPLFVDIDPRTYTMDPNRLEDLVCGKARRSGTAKIRSVIPIHLYGQPAAMEDISGIAARFGLKIVEDACQSHLGRYNGISVGNFGSAASFSFYPVKNLGAAGEAGAVITNDDGLARSMRQLRDHGQVEKYKHAVWGHNYRMDGIQGAVLGVKLKYLKDWTERRRRIAQSYHARLEGVVDLVLPHVDPKAHHVYHLFVVRTKRRSDFQRFLSSKGIATALHYPIPLHFQEACRDLGYQAGDFPESEAAANECISLPLYPELGDDQFDHVVSSVKEFFRS